MATLNRISIIIPTYNSIKFIQHTLYSILSQTNCEKEIIVVDSGSKDGTVEFCAGKVDKVIYYPPGSMYAAINEGIRNASNEIVTYINSDDCYYHDILADYLNYIIEKDLDFAYALGDYMDANGVFRSSIYTPDVKLVKKYLEAGLLTFIQPSVIFKKKVFDILNGFNTTSLKYCSDYDFYCRVFKSDFSIGFYKKRVVTFRISDNQISNAHKGIMLAEEISIMSQYSTLSSFEKLWVRVMFKYHNAGNIFLRVLRGYQLSGKIKVSKSMSPF